MKAYTLVVTGQFFVVPDDAFDKWYKDMVYVGALNEEKPLDDQVDVQEFEDGYCEIEADIQFS